MLIQTIKNNEVSDWIWLTKKKHRELINTVKPEMVIFHIEDVYPDSPNKGEVVTLDFFIFNQLIRSFVLEEKRIEKRESRNHDSRSMYELGDDERQRVSPSAEDVFVQNEEKEWLYEGMQRLTPTQRRRFEQFAEGKSFSKIGRDEGVSYKAVSFSVIEAKRKIKKFEKETSKNTIFCRIK